MTAVGQYFRQDYLKVPDGASIFYEVRGDGLPAAIQCDGLGCDGFIWKYLTPVLAARRRVVHWHYRGHGLSAPPQDTSRIGIEFTCDDLARLLDHLRIDQTVLFGHSMGTQVALEFHRRHRDRVQGLVLVCGSYGTPLDTWHDHTLMRAIFPRAKKLVQKYPRVAKAITSRVLLTELAMTVSMRTELNPELMAKTDFWPYLQHLANMDPLMFIATLDSLKDHSALDHLAHIDCPSLVVGGEIDRFTPVWLAQRMAELIPGCEYLFVPGGSHTAPLERPGMVNRAIDRFLREKVDVRVRRAG
jgi:pimeloyl-ACP methyl ester carboxylesterase